MKTYKSGPISINTEQELSDEQQQSLAKAMAEEFGGNEYILEPGNDTIPANQYSWVTQLMLKKGAK